ncbi:MAG: hypothetical protein QMC81_02850 [Thermoanaerobacterales bacterium]|nr:hypothetical protein [Thermoanaerobacterales bacterium]
MRLLIVSSSPEVLSNYLRSAGHETKDCISTDLAARMAEGWADVILFNADAVQVQSVSHMDALKTLVPLARVVLLADKTSELVPYAAALGVRDFVFMPAAPAEVLHRVENPARAEEAADALRGLALPRVEPEAPDRRERKPGIAATPTEQKPSRIAAHTEGVFGNLFRKRRGNERSAQPVVEAPPDIGSRELPEDGDDEPCTESQFHSVLTVWNPSGVCKTCTALNLAAAAARGGYDVALVNLDLVCPELDIWFGIQQTTVERRKGNLTHGVGLMTFGEALPVEVVPKMLQEYGWGIKYLPAGNKLGNIGTPDFELGTIERAIEAVAGRDASRPALTILNAAACFELPCSYGALKAADVILIPTTDAPQEAEVVTQQISELRRVGVDSKIIEVLWTLGNGKREPVWPGIERIVVPRDDAGYLAAAAQRNPYAATEDGRSLWEKVLTGI